MLISFHHYILTNISNAALHTNYVHPSLTDKTVKVVQLFCVSCRLLSRASSAHVAVLFLHRFLEPYCYFQSNTLQSFGHGTLSLKKNSYKKSTVLNT